MMFYGSLPTQGNGFEFDCVLQVRIQDDINRNSRLRLQVRRNCSGLGPSSLYSNNHSNNEGVQLQLFDETDPYMFYSVQINEELFQRLKVQQHLLVDFGSFPQRLIDLLQLCASEDSATAPRYQCELQVERASRTGHLHVTEINGFKKLVHLSVRLTQADEVQVRKTIVSRLTQLKSENSRLESSLKAAEAQLNEKHNLYERQLHSQQAQMEKMKADFERDMQQLRDRFETELRRDKDGIQREMSERVQMMCRERSDVEATLKERVRVLEAELQNGQFGRATIETRMREAQAEAEQAQMRLSQEKENSRMLQERLDSLMRNDCSQENGELRMKLAQLKVDLETARTDLCKANMEIRRLEETVEHKQGQVERRDAGIKAMSEDIVKANEIIAQLQAETKAYQSKLRVRSDVIMKQEEVIGAKDKELKALRERLKPSSSDNNDKENGNRIQVLEKQVAHKDNVIQWLNKKLNEVQGHKIDTPLLKGVNPSNEQQGAFGNVNSGRGSNGENRERR